MSSHEGCRGDSCVVAAGDHLYVCGGCLEHDDLVTKAAERFNTVENKWEAIADMQQERARAFGVAMEGKIFLAGGCFEETVKTCEMYIISTNEWQLIGSLTIDHFDGSMVCLKGKLYVLGGTDVFGDSRLSVECYDPIEDKWIEKTTIPAVKMISKLDKYYAFTGCVLNLSQGVLDKLDVI